MEACYSLEFVTAVASGQTKDCTMLLSFCHLFDSRCQLVNTHHAEQLIHAELLIHLPRYQLLRGAESSCWEHGETGEPCLHQERKGDKEVAYDSEGGARRRMEHIEGVLHDGAAGVLLSLEVHPTSHKTKEVFPL